MHSVDRNAVAIKTNQRIPLANSLCFNEGAGICPPPPPIPQPTKHTVLRWEHLPAWSQPQAQGICTAAKNEPH